MWHEARRSERKVHDLMDAARKRAQRRAVFLAKRRGDPQQSLQVVGSRCRVHRDDGLYQASEDQQGLIPWNAKQDILIDRFDGRALLDFIRDSDSRRFRLQQKTEEEEELEEFVNFERYRDLIKHRRRGFSDEDGILHANQEMEARVTAPFASERPKTSQSSASKATYSQVGFSYSGDGNEETNEDSEDDDGEEDGDDDEKDFSSDDSNDEGLEAIAKDFGVKRYNWLLFMDKKAKEEERRQKEIIKGDPSVRKLSRKERRKASQIERERDREATRTIGRVYHNDPYRGIRRSPTYDAYHRSQRSRSRSRSRSPYYSRRRDRGHADNGHRSRSKPSKIEYITEFGGSTDLDVQKLGGYSPPSSPLLHASPVNRSGNSTFNICKDRDNLLFSADTLVLLGSWVPKADYQSGLILEALHTDPASAVSVELENSNRLTKPSVLPSTSSATAKLNKTTNGGPLKSQQAEKKETPQERLKRIMSKQLNKQIKKDSAAEMAKKREQERLRQEKLEETSRLARLRYRSPSRSHSRSPRRHRYSRSRSGSRSPRRYRSSSHSRSPRERDRSRH